MGLYSRYILPRIINSSCGLQAITDLRAELIPLATGRVLEIGFGSGRNLRHYDGAKVERLFALEPELGMRKLAAKYMREPLPFEFEFIGLSGEEIPLENDSVDCVVITYTLCTIPDALKALEGMRRVLRPGGSMILAEHGKAPDTAVQVWQDRLTPLWRIIGGGCHLNRDIPDLIKRGGFAFERMEQGYLEDAPKYAGFNTWGIAKAA